MVSMYVLGQRDFLFLYENFAEESLAWFEQWTRGTHPNTATKAILVELLNCQVERSFSTLMRVKIWLRSTISTERMSGLCMPYYAYALLSPKLLPLPGKIPADAPAHSASLLIVSGHHILRIICSHLFTKVWIFCNMDFMVCHAFSVIETTT